VCLSCQGDRVAVAISTYKYIVDLSNILVQCMYCVNSVYREDVSGSVKWCININ